MAHAQYIMDTYGYKNTQYVMLIAFPLQQWLHERASTYTAHIVEAISFAIGMAVPYR